MFVVSRRAGTAPIEFVLVLPLLLFLCAGLFLMSRATIAKEAAATQARREAWSKQPQADAGDVFRLNHDPMRSRVSSVREIQVYGGSLFRAADFKAESRSAVMGHVWDHRNVRFDPVGYFQIHTSILRLILGNLDLGLLDGVQKFIGGFRIP